MNQTISIEASHDRMGAVEHFIKRLADIMCSLLGLILLSPVYAVIVVLMKRQHNGSVFFRQERIGYKGKPFTIYKFRTMSSVIEDKGPQLVAKSDSTCSTPLEMFLRDHHLDELPQLWNVLKGDMSLVGPRPERRYFIDKIMEHDASYPLVFEMRPGLTSEATLYNGYTDTIEKMLTRLHMDIAYLKKRTLWTDVTIIFKTFASIVSGRKF